MLVNNAGIITSDFAGVDLVPSEPVTRTGRSSAINSRIRRTVLMALPAVEPASVDAQSGSTKPAIAKRSSGRRTPLEFPGNRRAFWYWVPKQVLTMGDVVILLHSLTLLAVWRPRRLMAFE
jgi:hypothetical protein